MQLSVITTVYNQEKYIAKTIESVLSQKTNFNYEYIIADDCSTDNSAMIIEQYSKSHKNIIFFKNKQNIGAIANYTQCLKIAKGKYITGLGGDDLWSNPLKLQKQFDFLENNPKYGMVHTQFDCWDENKKVLIKNKHKKKSNLSGELFNSLLIHNPICAISTCFRKELIERTDVIKNFETNNYHFEDLFMWLEISKHSLIGYQNESTVTYRIIDNSISHPTSIGKMLEYNSQRKKITDFFINKYKVARKIVTEVDNKHKISICSIYLQFNKIDEFKSLYHSLTYKPYRLILINLFINIPFLRNFFIKKLIL